MSTIAENIANIRAQMAEAAKKAGRDPSEILLCAATKMNDAERVKEAVAAGVDCCGENRVQEIQAKRPLGAYTGKPLHFIGHLQTNKVKYLVGVVDLIESVDRLELLECIEKQAEKLGVVQNILFEVNIGNEESKSGLCRSDVIVPFAKNCGADAHHGRAFGDGVGKIVAHAHRQAFHGHIIVFFCPYVNKKIAHFGKISAIFARKFAHRGNCHQTLERRVRKIGHSGGKRGGLGRGKAGFALLIADVDLKENVLHGSTMVRIGTAIFGKRNYNI